PKTIKAPELKGLNNFRIYETVSSYNISKKDYRVGGSRSFKTPVIPQVAGEISIPGVEFNYFDPVKGRYVVKKSGLLNMKVTVPDRKDTSGGSETVAEELRVVREDIRYISSGMGREAAEPLYRRKGFWQVEGIPLYMLAVLLASSAFRKKVLEPRSEEIKRKKAFNRIIKEARKHASKGHGPEVYRRIYELSKNIGGPSVGELGDIIKRAQAAVYSPDKESPGDAGADLNRFIRLLRKGLKIAAALLILAGTDCFSSQSSIKKQFDEANENYRTGRFREALDIYKELLEGKHGYEGIYYNIGNTYWRLGEQGKARLFWEKALELNPGNADAYYNREIIAKSIQEKTEPGFLEGLMDSVDSLIGLNNMIISVSAAGWITLFIFMLFYLSRKEVYLWAGAMLLIIFIIAAGLLFVQIGNGQIKEGVVLSAADIYDSPSDNAAVQGTLPEASKVLIVQDKGDWMEIGIKEKNLKIWIKKDKIDII
ncbi:MAG: BatD family protein, partial [Elusimicrobia bacterium]|nr:BatD family protein [Elusimicrobiota bacterium]